MARKTKAVVEPVDEYEFMVVKICFPADGSDPVIVAGEVGTPDEELEPLGEGGGGPAGEELKAAIQACLDAGGYEPGEHTVDTDTFVTFVDNGDGSYTFTPADGGDDVTIDTNETLTSLDCDFDAATNVVTFTYTDEAGTPNVKPLDLSALAIDINVLSFDFDETASQFLLTETDGTIHTISGAQFIQAMTVADSDCLDLSLTGAGTVADPWVVSVTAIMAGPQDGVENATSCIPGEGFFTPTPEIPDPPVIQDKDGNTLDSSDTVTPVQLADFAEARDVEDTDELFAIDEDGECQLVTIPQKETRATDSVCNTTTVTEQANGDCEIETLAPRTECIVIEECMPATQVVPPAAFTDLFPVPFRNEDNGPISYLDGDTSWSYDCTLEPKAWRLTSTKPRNDSKIWCSVPGNIASPVPNNPFPSGPTDLYYDPATGEIVDAADPVATQVQVKCPRTGTVYDLPGSGGANEAPMGPNDVVQYSFNAATGGGHIAYSMTGNCTNFERCHQYVFVLPVIAISSCDLCGDFEFALDPISGDPNTHFVVGYIKDAAGNVIAWADNTPPDNAPAYPVASMTFTGVPRTTGDVICVEIVDTATAYANAVGAPPSPTGSIVLASDAKKLQFFQPGTNDIATMVETPLPCNPDGTIDWSGGPYITNDVLLSDPPATITDQASYDAYLATTVKSQATLCSVPESAPAAGDQECYYGFCSPLTLTDCPEILELVKVVPFVKAITPDPDDCGKTTSGILEEGNCICSNPSTPANWVQLVELDGDRQQAVTGGDLWNPADAGITRKFGDAPGPGSVIRNIIKPLGGTAADEVVDEKVYPSPSSIITPGTITFSNGSADTSHPCYAGDLYDIRIDCFDAAGDFVETAVIPQYDPAVAAPDLSGLSATVAAKISAGTDNFTLAYNDAPGDVVAKLTVTHVYTCPDSAFDTTLATSQGGESYVCDFVPNLGASGVALQVDNTDLTPDPGADFAVCFTDAATGTVAEFAAGTMWTGTNGQIPAGNGTAAFPSGTTVPMLGGVYHAVLKTPDGETKPVGCFAIAPWTKADLPAPIQMNYRGQTGVDPIRCYRIPVDANLDTLQTTWETLSVADTMFVFDCTNPDPSTDLTTGLIYTSGSVSNSSPVRTDIDVSTADKSCGYLWVCTRADGVGGASEVSISTLQVGCCSLDPDCVMPDRHPFLMCLNTGDSGCGNSSLYVVPPYARNPSSSLFGGAIYSQVRPNGLQGILPHPVSAGACLDPKFTASNVERKSAGVTCSDYRVNFDVAACTNNSLIDNTTVVAGGTNVVVDFGSTVDYTAAKNLFDTILVPAFASIAPANHDGFVNINNIGQSSVSKDVLCPDDETANPIWSFWFNPAWFTWDAVAEEMTFAVPGDLIRGGTTCCPGSTITQADAIEALARFYKQVSSVGEGRLIVIGSVREISSGAPSGSAVFNYSVSSTTCTTQPNRQYTYCWDFPAAAYQLWLGPKGTGTLISDQGNIPFQCGFATGVGNSVTICDEAGWVLSHDVVFASATGAADLATRLSALVGSLATHIGTPDGDPTGVSTDVYILATNVGLPLGACVTQNADGTFDLTDFGGSASEVF